MRVTVWHHYLLFRTGMLRIKEQVAMLLEKPLYCLEYISQCFIMAKREYHILGHLCDITFVTLIINP